MKKKNNRRVFLKSSIALGGTVLMNQKLFSNSAERYNTQNKVKENYTILFQGDSITDGGRSRNNDWNHLMGHGYVYIASSKLWYQYPDTKFKIYNRGVSGNTVIDLEKRWEADTLALKPDLLSVLIGINDVYKFIKGDTTQTSELFETTYHKLLSTTKSHFPDIQFVLCEPFMLPVGTVKDKFELYTAEIKKRQAIVKKMSTEFNAIFIPMQQLFNEMLKRAPADYWIWDGIHPMPAGHELMAMHWMDQVQRKLGIRPHGNKT